MVVTCACMTVTHLLSNTHGNIWFLTGANGELLDRVIAAGPNQAMLAVQHMVPRAGRWVRSGGVSRFVYDADVNVNGDNR